MAETKGKSKKTERYKYKEALKKIEVTFGAKAIAYITSDRRPPKVVGSQVALDVLEPFYAHLKSIGKCEAIALLLYTTGGNLDTPWPLINLIREFAERLIVLVPFKALSAGTLLACGANEIVMGPLGQLSPVDPEGHYRRGDKTIDIEVEDIRGFVSFIKEQVGISEQSGLTEAVKTLTAEVSPTILGNIDRTRHLIRRLAKRLLELHLRSMSEQKRVDQIVNNLAELLYSHSHFINRKEAKDIGFGKIIRCAKEKQLRVLENAFELYAEELKLRIPFDLMKDLGMTLKPEEAEGLAIPKEIPIPVPRAIIESPHKLHVFETKYIVQVKGGQVNVMPGASGWVGK